MFECVSLSDADAVRLPRAGTNSKVVLSWGPRDMDDFASMTWEEMPRALPIFSP